MTNPAVQMFVADSGRLVLRVEVPESVDFYAYADSYLVERVSTRFTFFLSWRIKKARHRLLRRCRRLASALRASQ